MKKNIFLVLAVIFAMTACKDSFLDRKPQGGTLRQDQYDVIDEKVEGTVRGLYVKLYSMSGGHDEFGKRSIDLWGDILCGDIALTNPNYGWLVYDEQMQTASARTGTIWGFYYGIIHNANKALADLFVGDSLFTHIAKYGFPSESTEYKFTKQEYHTAIMYAQVLALRGYCYAQLAKWYTPVEECSYFKGKTIETYDCCPIYTENNMDAPQPLASSNSVYNQAFEDMGTALGYYREFDKGYTRPNKLTFDRSVVCGLLAQAYLNEVVYVKDTTIKSQLQTIQDLAEEAIAYSPCKVLPFENLLTNGFNNVQDNSWMWGQDVTVETSGGLKSWFGQVDIHSYSYAWAGATKAIDQALMGDMNNNLWDKRRNWFNKTTAFEGCPDKKFFSEKNPTSTDGDSIDREWLSDNVFMRIESMHMIAAEAAYRMGDQESSIAHLKVILDERADTIDTDAKKSYAEYINNLSDPAKLEEALIYNWRVEFWGEGYGLETFRRWNVKRRVRGSNHYYGGGHSNMQVSAYEDRFNMNIPSGEATYNPYVDAKEE